RNVALAEADASDAEARLYDWQIQHATITAPIDGQVLKGDLTDKKGSQVKQGEEQMLVAPIDQLRGELQVNDRDIQDVKEGQSLKVATTSEPLDRHSGVVERVIPLGQPKEGNNVFVVYAKLNDVDAGWRPGMAGEARVDVGKRTWAWIWTHRLI